VSSSFELWYGPLRLGSIRNVFSSDDTWFGIFESGISEEDGDLQRRLCDFIGFCEEWNERVGRDEEADAKEFDQFSDLLNSGAWHTRTASGDVAYIDQAPVFFEGGDLSWRNRNGISVSLQ
jgi:hypothetical protein